MWRVERPFHRQRQVDTGDVILKVDRRVGGMGEGGRLGGKGMWGCDRDIDLRKEEGEEEEEERRGGERRIKGRGECRCNWNMNYKVNFPRNCRFVELHLSFL